MGLGCGNSVYLTAFTFSAKLYAFTGMMYIDCNGISITDLLAPYTILSPDVCTCSILPSQHGLQPFQISKLF